MSENWQDVMIKHFGSDWLRESYSLVEIGKLAEKLTEAEKELALKDTWVEHHQKSVEAVMASRNVLLDRIRELETENEFQASIMCDMGELIQDKVILNKQIDELEYQLEQQQIMNPISVNMLATVADLSKKLKIAIDALEWIGEMPDVYDASGFATDTLKEITNEKDKA